MCKRINTDANKFITIKMVRKTKTTKQYKPIGNETQIHTARDGNREEKNDLIIKTANRL